MNKLKNASHNKINKIVHILALAFTDNFIIIMSFLLLHVRSHDLALGHHAIQIKFIACLSYCNKFEYYFRVH